MRRLRSNQLLRFALVTLIFVAVYLFVFFGARAATPAGPYTLVVQPGVSDESLQLVLAGLTIADEYLIETTGRTVEAPTEVRVASVTPCSPLAPIPPLAATAQVLGNRLCVNTSSRVWRQALQDNPGIALAVIAHEHYHVWQNELGCLPPPWNKQYDWLIEGSATFVGWETVIASGNLDRAWVDQLLQSMLASDPDLASLAAYERGIGGDASYSLAYQAAHDLVARTGSLESLNDFCGLVGQGAEWRQAFTQTFGLSPDQFYAEFKPARRSSSR